MGVFTFLCFRTCKVSTQVYYICMNKYNRMESTPHSSAKIQFDSFISAGQAVTDPERCDQVLETARQSQSCDPLLMTAHPKIHLRSRRHEENKQSFLP